MAKQRKEEQLSFFFYLSLQKPLSGTFETAGDQGQGEGANPVLSKAERGGES